MRTSVLGVPYTLEYRKKAKDTNLAHCDGYCDFSTKTIVVKDYTAAERREPMTMADLEAYKRKCMRHEITHAFLYESGLSINSLNLDGSWATNEEMVDWVAIQGPKLYAAWTAAKCL